MYKSVPPSPEVMAARDSVLAALKPHQDKLSGVEILAVLAYTVGQAIALQDQKIYTADILLKLVGENIEQGNAEAISAVQNVVGHA